MVRLVLILTALSFIAAAPPGLPTADSIFSRAADVARHNADPPFLTYMMHEVFVHHGKRTEYDYRVWYRNDGKGLMQNFVSNRRHGTETIFGYPFPFSPDVNFLLNATPEPRTAPPPPVGTPIPEAAGNKAPPLLDVQKVVADRNYGVVLTGVEDYHGRGVYHLMLRALRNERDHPLKELWVDRETFEVWKARAGASGSKGPAVGSISGDAEFAPVGKYWLVSRASGDGQLHFGFISDSGHYEYIFSNFGFPNSLPDWYFDPEAFRHKS